ncbi:MAG: NAD(P)-dependent alcohol dehydrogenase [Acidobacteria bacterium]|nr:NAD(P)-dependent alcohol dehydrogenase [Acidobacteriota bacterium]
MKAIVYYQYGPPDILRCEEIEKVTPGDGEVSLKIRAASLNPYDWHFMRGLPYGIRLMVGIGKPKNKRLGADVAGVVESVGRNVTQFKPGDAVYGVCHGAFGEFVCTAESKLVKKPDSVSFEHAACVPIAALTALQALRDKGKIRPQQSFLVNGASGGVGTFAVQIAKSLRAKVTGVTSTRNLELVRSLGADEVIDYTKQDFTKGDRRFDLILDCIGNHSFSECRRVLNRRGTNVAAGGKTDDWMVTLVARKISAAFQSLFVSQKEVSILAKMVQADLLTMNELLVSGKVTPVIDHCCTLEGVPDAIRYLEEGHARGKVVMTVPN